MFKPGDLVKFVGITSRNYINGNVYVVREYPTKKYGGVGTVLDELGSKTNGHDTKFFQLVKKREKFHK